MLGSLQFLDGGENDAGEDEEPTGDEEEEENGDEIIYSISSPRRRIPNIKNKGNVPLDNEITEQMRKSDEKNK